ncbi:RDD family protein [Streptococcus gallolyticus]|uniref:RDD family protein n=1 Tax=Streptococcus hepaticus TaxID=3349163 RepID=UPI001C9465E8|nr:RDD family protein [Streptococcus gallolyticus]MBY5040116.1 RDD family protein [Streptococcus gallolyticus]
MKKLLFLQRILASLIDMMIIYLPFEFLLVILFQGKNASEVWLVHILFVLYNTLACLYFEGQTLGKYFAGLAVTPVTKSAAEMGQREAAKLLYLIPYGGLAFMLISVLVYVRQGKFLHDVIGKSEVIVLGKH